MHPIKQYLKERVEEFDEKFLNPDKFSSATPLNPIYSNGRIGYFINDIKSFHSETIKGLIERLVKEEKLKEGNNGDGLPFESSPELYGNARLESYKKGYNQAKQENRDRLLELIK